MLILQNISYLHADKELLFSNINFSIQPQQKIALLGNNGAGKSTLLKIIAGVLIPASGTVKCDSIPYYIPQIVGQFNELTIAEALGVNDKLTALKEILNGNVSTHNLSILNDDWTIEERCKAALAAWKLETKKIDEKMSALSGGEKTKVFLAGIALHKPQIILMDEPGNHLDLEGKQLLYNMVSASQSTMIIVSHDRTLLNIMPAVLELRDGNIASYSGNYDFYSTQKTLEKNALLGDISNKEKVLRKAKQVERETMERQQKLDARGKKKQEKAGMAKIMLNTLRNNAEKSTARIKAVHTEKLDRISIDLQQLRAAVPDAGKMKFNFDNALLHHGKVLIKAKAVNHAYDNILLWSTSLNFEIRMGERIAIRGKNGSGKTSLLKILMQQLTPSAGSLEVMDNKTIYIDQDYSLLTNEMTVYEQAAKFNIMALPEHEIKNRLTHFLFTKESWAKKCMTLSGGEKLKLILCCLQIQNKAPDLIILDEPTNNLDITNADILTNTINDYKGTLLVVSHDTYFLNAINLNRTIGLDKEKVY